MKELTIIIRTSYRPVGFWRAWRSCSTHASGLSIRRVVGYDTDEALEYLPECHLVDLRMYCAKDVPFFYNLYLNKLLQHTQELGSGGHVLFLDDDDFIIPGALSKLEEYLVPGRSLIVPFLRGPAEFKKPSPAQLSRRVVLPGYVGLPSLILAVEDIPLVKFAASEHADYLVIKELHRRVDLRFVDCPVVSSPVRGRGVTEKNTVL